MSFLHPFTFSTGTPVTKDRKAYKFVYCKFCATQKTLLGNEDPKKVKSEYFYGRFDLEWKVVEK